MMNKLCAVRVFVNVGGWLLLASMVETIANGSETLSREDLRWLRDVSKQRGGEKIVWI